MVAADRFSMFGSEPKFCTVKAESGRTIHFSSRRAMNRGSCETYGSPIMIRRPGTPHLPFIQVGSLNVLRSLVGQAAPKGRRRYRQSGAAAALR